MKALAIGDVKNAILIIQQSQMDPQKAIAELVENAIDAAATQVRIIRRRVKGSTEIAVEDNGEGVKAGKDGNPDFDRVARSICDSFKRQLDAGDRRNIQGEFAIGILGFHAVGRELELISRNKSSETRGLRLFAGSVEYDETFVPDKSLPTQGTVARIRDIRKEIQNRLTAEKLSRYLGSELRDRIRATGVSIRVVDRLPGGKELLVKPREFEGERLGGIGPVDTVRGKVKFELYVTNEDTEGGVGVARRGTRLLDDICAVEELKHDPWNRGRLEGLIHCDFLTPAPVSRKGIVPDDNLRYLLEAALSVEPKVVAVLKAVEEQREEILGRELLRRLQETFASILDELPEDYDWFDTRRGGPLPTTRTGGQAKPKEMRISRGPLHSVEIVPRLAQLAPGEVRKLTARALDPTGALILIGVNYSWRVGSSLASLTSDGPVATLQAGGMEGEGAVYVTAQQAQTTTHSEGRFLILDVKRKAQGRKLPFLEALRRPGEQWRSRWVPARNVIEYNSGHPNYLRSKERGRKDITRYLALLVAKELILHNFSGTQQTLLLERMVEVVSSLQAKL